MSKDRQSEEYMAFSQSLARVLQVSHSEMKQMLEREKAGKKVKTKPQSRLSSLGRASGGKG